MERCWDTDLKVRPTFDEIFIELKNTKSGANRFDITIPRERPLNDEEMREERRDRR